MPVADRGDPVLVSRHLTYSIGADVCYGKWGEGSYTNGRPGGGYTCSGADKCKAGTSSVANSSPFALTINKNGWDEPTCNTCTTPDDWRDSTNLFRVHRTVKKSVQYCQCFVYAAITTTIGRALGIPTRPVTTFQSAHDTDKNRAIEKFYTIDPSNGEFVPLDNSPTADSVWSFHVWNEMYFKRPEFTSAICRELGFSASASRMGCANGWQAVDATPQESSMGGSGVDPKQAHYQMGPASINFVKANVDPTCPFGNNTKYGCFDNEFVISEVNSNVHMWLKTEDTTKEYSPGLGYQLYGDRGFFSDPWGDKYNTIGLQISTKKKGAISEACKKEEEKDCSNELDDITKYYKKKEDSGPGTPTLPGHAMKESNSAEGTYYVPGTNAEGHRRLFNGRYLAGVRRLDTPSGVKGPGMEGSTLAMGTWPGTATDPIANAPNNPYSSIYVDFPFENQGTEEQKVMCNYKAYVSDYTGTMLTKVDFNNDTLTIAVGTSASCNFETHRGKWYIHASTTDDHAINSNVPITDKNNIPYFLKVEVTATVDSTKELFVAERIKKIGEVMRTTRANFYFRNMGKVASEDLDNVVMPAMDTCMNSKNILSGGVRGDGYCAADRNIEADCYDGGDCCLVSCMANIKGLSPGQDDPPFCNLQADDSLCIDPAYKNYLPPVDKYDRQSPEEIFSRAPVAFEDTGGATDLGLDICRSVFDDSGVLQGPAGIVDEMIANDFGTGNACESDSESDACKALLQTALCDTYALALSDCLMVMVNASEIPLTTENIPRCAHAYKTVDGCTCKSQWEFGGKTFDYGTCGTPDDVDYNMWCKIDGTTCGTASVDGTWRWDYCTDDQPVDPRYDPKINWTEEKVAEFFPEQDTTKEAAANGIKSMVLRSTVPEPEPAPTCAFGEALVDNECKTVCGARRFLSDMADNGGCLVTADSPDDCNDSNGPKTDMIKDNLNMISGGCAALVGLGLIGWFVLWRRRNAGKGGLLDGSAKSDDFRFGRDSEL